VALGLAWVFGAVALQTPGRASLRGDVQRSEILSRLYARFPPADVLNLLARFDPFPQIQGPRPTCRRPTARSRATPTCARPRRRS
jgi:hypothetical protein